METITVEAVTREPKEFGGETMWGVKVHGSWLDLHVSDRPEKGQAFQVETEKVTSKGKTYVHARPVGAQTPKAQQTATQPPRPPQPIPLPGAQVYKPETRGGRATPYSQPIEVWETVAKRAHLVAKELEPGENDARARLALVSSFLIAFGDGKLVLDAIDEDWGKAPEFPQAPARPEVMAAALHLQKTIWDYCEKTGKVAGHDIVVLKQVSGHSDWFNMTEKEAIAARLGVEKMIDDAIDYKSELTSEVKQYFANQGWNFADATPDNVARKQTILRELGINPPFKEASNADAKKALARLRDPSFLPF